MIKRRERGRYRLPTSSCYENTTAQQLRCVYSMHAVLQHIEPSSSQPSRRRIARPRRRRSKPFGRSLTRALIASSV